MFGKYFLFAIPFIDYSCPVQYIRMMQQILPMMFMSQGGNGTTAASVLISSILHYQNVLSQYLPVRFQLILVSMVNSGWLEHVLDQLIRFVIWTLFVCVLAIV